MSWTRFAMITIGAGLVTSLTDWFFAGDWIHRRYTYPEIWRQGAEAKAIALTSPLPFITCGVFAYITAWLGVHSVAGSAQIGDRGMGDWAFAVDPDQCCVYEAASGVCNVVRNRLVGEACDRRDSGRLAPSLTANQRALPVSTPFLSWPPESQKNRG